MRKGVFQLSEIPNLTSQTPVLLKSVKSNLYDVLPTAPHYYHGKDEVFPEKVHTVSRLLKLADEDLDYSGVFYSNCVRANKRVNLLGLGFYGPSRKDHAKYAVDIQVEKLSLNETSHAILSIKQQSILSEKNEIFYLDLPNPLIFEQGQWYIIRFQLDGPPTSRGLTHLNTVQADSVKFDFYYGSSQMPHLKFSI